MPIADFRLENEPVLAYRPGSPKRRALRVELQRQSAATIDIPLVVGGRRVMTAQTRRLTAPHDRERVLASVSQAGADDVTAAIAAAHEAHHDWSRRSLEERAAVFLKAADLLAGPWRQRLNAATMLGQSKTVHQAEIDSACELIDFLRCNVAFAAQIEAGQPLSSAGVCNVMDYRPLEGFVYAVTPFNFTAIGGNLPTAPALMGNTVLWKPAATAALSNYLFLELLEEAGLPPGVINFVPGDGAEVSRVALASPALAGIHFTGSTAVFDGLWQQVGLNLSSYASYPRLVGETGGKDFVIAHASADVDALAVGLLRGAFEYQGQKCSAASRAYIPRSLWPRLKERLLADVAGIALGDVANFTTFMGAVIDAAAMKRIRGYLDTVPGDASARIISAERQMPDHGYFVAPTVIEVDDPSHRLMTEEIFGPVLSVNVYDDAAWNDTLALLDRTSPYALTGAVFARDRAAIAMAADRLRYSAGNFYINDKPTGAVVGQQPFGGARRSGTNDKAGSALNLMRWTSPRVIKETYVPPYDYRYPAMSDDS